MKGMDMTQHESYKEGPTNFEQDPVAHVKFNEYAIGLHAVGNVAGIRAPIVDELSEVFAIEPGEEGWTTDNLGSLIAKIGPAKTLQDNIQATEEVLSISDGKDVAIAWVEASGLLEAVARNFEDPSAEMPTNFDSVVISGGVRNWMMRRANLLKEMIDQNTTVNEVVLAAGTRAMKTTEGPDVQEGDTEATYLEREIKPMLESVGLNVAMLAPDTEIGDEVASAVAEYVKAAQAVLVVCSAGNWIQNGGQIRRAIGGDINKVYVASDTFPVAKNDELPATHQNPFTALGIIARNLQELQRHAK